MNNRRRAAVGLPLLEHVRVLRPLRALTLGEEALLAMTSSDFELPDDPEARADEIDRLARTEED